MKKPILLAPAGDFTSLRAALSAGADAVYFGLKGFNMREASKNFLPSDLSKVVSLCKKHNAKAYLAINTIIYEKETKRLENFLKKAKNAKIDAVIAWDFSVLCLARKLKIPIHLSTQASVSNFEAAFYYNKKFGVKSINLARECTLSDIKSIIRKIKSNHLYLDIETFIHGAMCVSVSGRCFMSNDQFNKSANRGECLQPCRRSYIIKDPEEGHELKIENSFVLSPNDLCAMPFLDKLISSGISTFKIEGRNKSPDYVFLVTSCYRNAIDAYFQKIPKKEFDLLKKALAKKLEDAYNRGFSEGFYMGRPIRNFTDSYGSKATKKKIYVGKIVNFYGKSMAAEISLEGSSLKIGDTIQVHGPTTGVIEQKIKSMQLHNKSIENAKKGSLIGLKTQNKVRRNDRVFLFC